MLETKPSSVHCADGVGHDLFFNKDNFSIENIYWEAFAGNDITSMVRVNSVLESVYAFGKNFSPHIRAREKPLFTSLSFGYLPLAVFRFSSDSDLRHINVHYRGHRMNTPPISAFRLPVWFRPNGPDRRIRRQDLIAFRSEEEPEYEFAHALYYKCALALVEDHNDNICLIAAHLCPYKLHSGKYYDNTYVWSSRAAFCDWAIGCLETDEPN